MDDASGYQIYRATKKSGKYARIATVSAEKTEYINTKLTCGKTYYYKLRAYQVKERKESLLQVFHEDQVAMRSRTRLRM